MTMWMSLTMKQQRETLRQKCYKKVRLKVTLDLQRMDLDKENSMQINDQEKSEFWIGAPYDWEDIDSENDAEEFEIQRGNKI